ncbi:MAG: DNA primase [Hydrogenophilus sp.]|nr:DNA primase [Hydrogenophilus sp.]
MIPQAFLDELLARVDIVDIIGRRIKLRKGGSNYFALCPFHQEKTPSFSVSPTRQFYHCFGCGAHGTAITFLMHYDGLSFREAVEALAHEVGLSLPASPLERNKALRETTERARLLEIYAKAARFYQQQLERYPNARAYLARRGISDAAIRHFGLGYAPPDRNALAAIFPHYRSDSLLLAAGLVTDRDGQRHDRFRHRILFPIHDRRGQIIAFGGRALGDGEPKYLNSPETPLFNKSRELYALALARDAIRTHSHALIVEGYLDVIQLWQHGIANAVAVLGTAATAEHIKALLSLTDRIIFAFDGDAAGQRAAWRALENALPVLKEGTTILFARLPEGEDPDSLLQKPEGLAAFHRALTAALPLSEYLIATLTVDLDLATPEGRAKLAHLASPLIARVAPPRYRQLLAETVAERCRLPVESLLSARALLSSSSSAPSPRFSSAPSLLPTRSSPSLATRLLRLLLLHPTLAPRVPISWLDDTEDQDLKAAVRLIDAIDHGELSPNLPLAAIVEHFHNDPPLHRRLSEHAAQIVADPPPDPEDPEAELNDLLHRLLDLKRQREIALLTAKARTIPLDPDETARLISLITERKRRQIDRNLL